MGRQGVGLCSQALCLRCPPGHAKQPGNRRRARPPVQALAAYPRWQARPAAGPLPLAYLGQDIYFLMYSNVFRMPEETRLRCARSIVPSPLIRWRGP